MSRLRATTPVEVDLGPCECPGTPHADGDKAWLRPRLTPEGGYRATSILVTAIDADQTAGALGMTYLVDGLVRWTLLDDEGKPVRTDEAFLHSGALDWDTTLWPIMEQAATLYSDSVMSPLLRGRQAPLPDGPTEASTSPTTDSSSENPTP
jgi:hypothetical protein